MDRFPNCKVCLSMEFKELKRLLSFKLFNEVFKKEVLEVNTIILKSYSLKFNKFWLFEGTPYAYLMGKIKATSNFIIDIQDLCRIE